MKRKEVISMIFGLLILAVLVSFSVINNAARPVSKIAVKFVSDEPNYFLNDSIINRIVSKDDDNLLNLTLSEVDIKKVEKKVAESPYVDSVQVSKNIDGTIEFDVKTNVPIARITSSKGEFYISKSGYRMPLSKLNSAEVMLVSGDVNENEFEDLSHFIQTIQKDEFFSNHFIGIEKVGKRSYNLLVNNANYYIELGTLNNFEKKLTNLKLFYEQYINFIGTEQYEKLSLKFINQVVSTKRTIHDEE